MILKAFSIRDVKVDFRPPFFLQNEALAIREMNRALKDPTSQVACYVEDLQLFRVGEFDTNTGVFNSYVKPEFICDIKSLISKED